MALAYRGHFVFIRNPRISSTGLNTSMSFVFTNTLLDILNRYEPTHLAAVFDAPGPTHRHEVYPEYKANREETPEELIAGLPYVFRLCEGFRIPVLRVPGYEADDVIGTLASTADAAGFETFMVSPDKDFAQLVSERTFLLKPSRGGSGVEMLGAPEVLEGWKIRDVDQVRDILGLMGDSTDNVPGVPGIGEKTAQKLIDEYGSVEALLEHIEERKGKQRENLEKYRDQALLSKQLVTIDCRVPLEVRLEALEVRERDDEALRSLFVELEFNTLGKRLFGDDFSAAPRLSVEGDGEAADGTDPEGQEETLKTLADVPHDYRTVDTEADLKALAEHLGQQESFCFDVETTGLDPKTCDLVGIAFSCAPHIGHYVPVPEDRGRAGEILDVLRPALQDPGITKIGHNLKFDLSTLKWYDLEVAGPVRDTMLAAHLAVPELRRSLDYLSQALLGYRPQPIVELIGERGPEQRTMREVPVEAATKYAVEDADVALQLWQALSPKVTEEGQDQVFYQIECPLVPVLVEMEYHGIRMDAGALEELSMSLEEEIAGTEKHIYELAGEPFNLNSPKQLGDVFFDKLQLDPNARRTQKSRQYQTNERVLTRLAVHHEIAAEVLRYRECTKLKSTYVDMLPRAICKRTGRIHTHFEQAVTATGRMQSSNPNLQNIPVRTERGREIRKAFVPRDEAHTLLSADYSQIELRIMAEVSKDEALLEAFRNNEDIHTSTAARVYRVPEDEVTGEMRDRAKTVNFGIIYGISAFGLSDRLGISRTEAADLIEQYFTTYPGVKEYMEATVAFAREKGYVITISGRRRFLRDIDSRNATTRAAAERNAINTPIQGSAADLIKIAMSEIHSEIRARGLRSKMLLQVHDELIFDMCRDEAEVLPPLVEEGMRHAIPMEVPIVVELGVADNWLDAH